MKKAGGGGADPQERASRELYVGNLPLGEDRLCMLYHSYFPSSSLLDAISSVKSYGLASTSGFFTHAALTPPISLLSSPHLHLLCLNRRPIPAVATVPRCCYSSGMTHLLHLQALPLHILILTFPTPSAQVQRTAGKPHLQRLHVPRQSLRLHRVPER